MEDETGGTLRRLAITIAVLVMLTGCAKKEPVSTAEKPEEGISEGEPLGIKQEVYSFRVEGFNKNKKSEWGIEGASANVLFDKININELKAVYYGEDTTFTVCADEAVYDKRTQDIELKKNVVGRTSDGGELVATYAKWNAETEEITTDSHVVITRKNISCRGKGMVTRPHLKKVRFLEEVVVLIEPDKRITCDGPFEVDYEKNVARFNKNVRIIDTESETLTDKLTVYLDPDTNEIERIVTEGNVEVVHRGDVEDIGKMSF